MHWHGRGVAQDHARAVRWFQRAAAQGDPHAQNILGLMYGVGKGVKRDYVVAYMWATISRLQGEEDGLGWRRLLAGRMTLTQLSEAKRLAQIEWARKQLHSRNAMDGNQIPA
jgi:TPR repeat protein